MTGSRERDRDKRGELGGSVSKGSGFLRVGRCPECRDTQGDAGRGTVRINDVAARGRQDSRVGRVP